LGFHERWEISLSADQLTAWQLEPCSIKLRIYIYPINYVDIPIPRSEIRCLTGRTDLTAGASDSSAWMEARKNISFLNSCTQKAKPCFSVVIYVSGCE
jgi:hypothetical protein